MVLASIPDHTEWVWFCSYVISAVMMSILCIVHSRKLYQDLFTEERACFSHRQSKPKLTSEYKFVGYLTITVLYFFFGASILFALEMASYTWSHQTCRVLNNAGGWPLVLGKGCMYMLFMYRLLMFYGDSALGYHQSWKPVLICIGWLNIVYAIVAESITTYLTITHWHFVQDFDGFPNPCFPIPDNWTVTIFATLMQIWDGIMNPLSLALFVLPLRKLRTIDNMIAAMGLAMDNSDHTAASRNTEQSIARRKVRYLAVKYTILTFVAFFTTLMFWSFVYIAPGEYFLVAFDVVINSICVMLMTDHYDDRVYYERLCLCFVICCRNTAVSPDDAGSEENRADLTATQPNSTVAIEMNQSQTKADDDDLQGREINQSMQRAPPPELSGA